jgi:Tol biopolymer transport system component
MSTASLLCACQSSGDANPGDIDAGEDPDAGEDLDTGVDLDAGVDGLGGGAFLVYNKWSDGHKHLFRSSYDGTGEIQLTAGEHDNVYPEMEGDTIFFSSGGRGGNPWIQIFTMDLDGSNVQLVPIELPDAHLYQPAHCGSYLFFAAFIPGLHDHLEIYRVDIGGGIPARLTTTTAGNPGFVWSQLPHCSPDHTQVVFGSTRSGSTQIWKMDVDGQNLMQLTFRGQRDPAAQCEDYHGVMQSCYADCNAPKWSSRDRIAMYCGIEQQHGEIFIMAPDGTEQIQLTDDSGILTNDNPFFSPDGSFVGYAHGDPGVTLTSLERIPADGGSRVRLVEGLGQEYSSAWGG